MKRDLTPLIVSPGDTLLHAMRVINTSGMEVAFVCDPDGRVLGTLTDGDIRRAILRGVVLDVPAVGSAMQQRFVAVDSTASRAEVLDMMRARGISQVPILDERGRLVGVHLLHELIGAAEKANWAVLMAGGMGMRLRPLTEHVPKPMLPVAGRPILERLVMHLVGHGLREIFLSVNYLGEVVEKHFGDGSAFGCRIRYLRETTVLGTGGALSLLPSTPDAPVLVMNGDLVTQVDVNGLLEAHREASATMTVCVRPYQVEIPFGVVDVESTSVVAIREKPSHHMLVNAGIYVIDPVLVGLVPREQAFPITNLIETCLSTGRSVKAYLVEDEWTDVGRHDELRKARGVL